ncbi:MAG: DUF5103 domain-containing protein [Paludibacteraceae bacterium]|nr:DUF5103 domain-containing protein [Paludibacteraceae bacterium]
MNNTVKLLIQISLITLFSMNASSQYSTKAFQDNIKTIQVNIVGGNKFALPIIELNSDEKLRISFDELSPDMHNLYYSVQHCNADWTASSISPMDWGYGFPSNQINDVQHSINTTVQYNHYSFFLPNEDFSFKISGNYVVSFYESSNPDKILATACFSVVETKVGVAASVRGNTDIDFSGKHQQLDFSIIPNSYPIENPASELKITVRQNGRLDNEVTDLTPTYMAQNKITYTNKSLIFEGGNEYHSFDFSSIYAYGDGIDHIKFFDPYYHVELYPVKPALIPSYNESKDVNGKFVVNIQNYDNDSITADYFLIHFSVSAEAPFFDGLLYVLGGFNYNQLDNTVQMQFNNRTKSYEQTVLLKQGGYNYLYAFRPKDSKEASTQRIEGSFWQTENEYAIYVYQRAFGQRYDKLIAVKVLQSGK